ncbi:DUF3019 domain-containing protein [Motilimonas eburnea]|uniref:DUF3019 domain-containing protein n=1 Tax=Motilimonas eburnea TaxID=1737488 RepID=UPI001E4EC244|nr:DUF3019 domain-containing protein [Motilimonas eburnea]MCE2570904.1 DUF3019 domain-containing protein [Motilimonas eburnea]
MFFNPLALLLTGFSVLIWLVPVLTLAQSLNDEPHLQVTPEKCVALREGRDCLAELTFKWQAKVQGDYCLIEQGSEKVLKCWQHSQQGEHKFKFTGQQTTQYSLIKNGQRNTLVSTQVEVSWVYKTKNKKRRWRLF